MRHRLLPLLFTMSLLSLLGCSGSTKDLPGKLADIRVKVEVEHSTDLSDDRDYTRRSIRVVLSNAKGADIERGDVKVEVNGTPMRFRVSQGNYYDRHPYYTLDDDDKIPLTPASELRFALILPDGARHDLGTLRTPAALSPGQFDFPTTAPATRPIKIGWRDLVEPAQLQLGRSTETKTDERTFLTEGTGPYDPNAPRRTIGPGWFRRRSGEWTVPEELMRTGPNQKLLWLEARIVATSEGKVAAPFAKQSSMQATRLIRLEMRFGQGS